MYKVLVVDDEPAAAQHICAIIRMKCPRFCVVGTAENGAEALDQIVACQPDVVISDVKMPCMDGIRLVSALRERHPDIMSVIVSGYQDFEYAKGALQSGVCDYLLKPLAPAELQTVMQALEQRLDALYYRKRIGILRAMCNNLRPEKDSVLEQYFGSQAYCAVILRKNGLPKRFTRQTGIEIFSTEEDTVLLYGRDEMEALYLYPQALLHGAPFEEVVGALFRQEQRDFHYVTAVMHGGVFTIHEFPAVVSSLYRTLDESVVIGKNRLVNDLCPPPAASVTSEELAQREHVEDLIRYRESSRLLAEVGKLFGLWERAGHNQIYTEAQIRYLLQLLQKQEPFTCEYGDYTFLIDDALYYAGSMYELGLEILELMRLLAPSLRQAQIDEPEHLLKTILAYIDSHLEEPLTISILCQHFGLSQATLSRWFRKYKDTSFSKYLTEARIERAKQILRKNPDALVKDVAERVGYSDQFYFSRIFRSVQGMCPKEYVLHHS